MSEMDFSQGTALEDFVGVDVETTGLHPGRDSILSIGAWKPEAPEGFYTLVRPCCLIPEEVRLLTGICPRDVEAAPPLEEALPKFLEYVGDRVWVGHHLPMDAAFLSKAMAEGGWAFERRGVDTLPLAKALLPSYRSEAGEMIPFPKTLESLGGYFGIDFRPHHALEDARAAYQLLEALWHMAPAGERHRFSPRPLEIYTSKERPASVRQRQRLADMWKLYMELRREGRPLEARSPLSAEQAAFLDALDGGVALELSQSQADRYMDWMRLAYGVAAFSRRRV